MDFSGYRPACKFCGSLRTVVYTDLGKRTPKKQEKREIGRFMFFLLAGFYL